MPVWNHHGEHMDTGCHIMLTESECVYDTRLRQWTTTVTSVKGKSQKIGDSQCHPDTTVKEKVRQG